MRKPCRILPLCLLLMGTVACAPTNAFDAGQPLSRDELASISEAIFATEPSPSAESHVPGTVHWSAGGSVYHADRNCYHLRRTETVISGTEDEAIAAGIGRSCADCGTVESETD